MFLAPLLAISFIGDDYYKVLPLFLCILLLQVIFMSVPFFDFSCYNLCFQFLIRIQTRQLKLGQRKSLIEVIFERGEGLDEPKLLENKLDEIDAVEKPKQAQTI